MEEKDLKETIVKIITLLLFTIVVTTLLTIFFVNKFGAKEITVNKLIDKKETLYVLVINNKTNNKDKIENILKDKEVEYTIVNKNRELHFKDFLDKLSITEEDIIEPTIIYVKDKKADSILVNIKNMDDLKDFLEYNMES